MQSALVERLHRAYFIVGNWPPGSVGRSFRRAQIVSGSLLALGHGANDAQKTMGVITLALVADGTHGVGNDPPFWVILVAAVALGLGTYSGGWRILRGTGSRVIKMDSAQGFSAQGARGSRSSSRPRSAIRSPRPTRSAAASWVLVPQNGFPRSAGVWRGISSSPGS